MKIYLFILALILSFTVPALSSTVDGSTDGPTSVKILDTEDVGSDINMAVDIEDIYYKIRPNRIFVFVDIEIESIKYPIPSLILRQSLGVYHRFYKEHYT